MPGPIVLPESTSGSLCAALADLTPGSHRVAGLITGLRTTQGRRGRMAIATLDDRSARIEVVVYPETLPAVNEFLAKGRIVVAEGVCGIDDFNGGYRITAERLTDIAAARERLARRLVLRLEADRLANGLLAELKSLLQGSPRGQCPVVIDYQGAQASAELALPDRSLDRMFLHVAERHLTNHLFMIAFYAVGVSY